MRGASSSEGQGGAIYADADVLLTNSRLENNSADSSNPDEGRGGAVSATGDVTRADAGDFKLEIDNLSPDGGNAQVVVDNIIGH